MFKYMFFESDENTFFNGIPGSNFNGPVWVGCVDAETALVQFSEDGPYRAVPLNTLKEL